MQKRENILVLWQQLSAKEQLFLNAAQFGQKEIVEELMADPEVDLNCVDYMGRNALILAVRSENLELLEILLNKINLANFASIEDALLHAVSSEKTHIVKYAQW